MDFFATLKDLSHVVVDNPLYSTIGCIILFICFVRLYTKLTLGLYDDPQEMVDKTVLITGATSGIGEATAYNLAKRKARVLLACRNLEKAEKVAEEIKLATGNQSVFVKLLDLSSFESVRKCAQDILKTERQLHVLINNAVSIGIAHSLTQDGCEYQMQTSHFGHFLLTMLLLDLLKKSRPSRIINVSSEGHRFANLDLDDLLNKKGRNDMTVYCNTKLANILFTKELAKKLDKTGVTVNAVHPGAVKTDLFRDKKGFTSLMFKCLFFFAAKTSEEGAQTTIKLAVDPGLENTTGKYFRDCKEAKVSKDAENSRLARQLFEISERITDATFPIM